MKPIIKVIGAASRSLIIELNGKKCFCSNKNYVKLLNDPECIYRIVTVPAHKGRRNGSFEEIDFPESKWVEVASFRKF